MSIDLNQDFFALFGLSRSFRVDIAALESAYHELHARVHPDRHAHLPDGDRRRAMQWATRVNEAFVTLKWPLKRAEYLLELADVDVGLETNTAMSPAFLIEQMEWREAVAEARAAADVSELEALGLRLRQRARELIETLAVDLDDRNELHAAAETVRRMRFVDKLQQEIDDALEALES